MDSEEEKGRRHWQAMDGGLSLNVEGKEVFFNLYDATLLGEAEDGRVQV